MSASFPRSPERGGAICGQVIVRIRADGFLGHLKAETHFSSMQTRLPAFFRSTVSTPSLTVAGGRRLSIPHTRALVARAVAQGLGAICNLTGSLSRWSFLSRFKFLQEPSRVSRILFRPNLSFAAAHVPKHEARSVGNVQKVVGEIQNVEC